MHLHECTLAHARTAEAYPQYLSDRSKPAAQGKQLYLVAVFLVGPAETPGISAPRSESKRASWSGHALIEFTT